MKKTLLACATAFALSACSTVSNVADSAMNMAGSAVDMATSMVSTTAKSTNTLGESFAFKNDAVTYVSNGKLLSNGTDVYKITSNETTSVTKGDVKTDSRQIKAISLADNSQVTLNVESLSCSMNDTWKATLNVNGSVQEGCVSNDVPSLDFDGLQQKVYQNKMADKLAEVEKEMTEQVNEKVTKPVQEVSKKAMNKVTNSKPVKQLKRVARQLENYP